MNSVCFLMKNYININKGLFLCIKVETFLSGLFPKLELHRSQIPKSDLICKPFFCTASYTPGYLFEVFKLPKHSGTFFLP